jgi:hypothetical protein
MAETKPEQKDDAKKSAKSTATGKASKGFTDEERVAMRERVQELKAATRRARTRRTRLTQNRNVLIVRQRD